MTELDKTGLEAAWEAVKAMDVVKQGEVEAAISAYLSTTSARVTEEQTPRVKQLAWEGNGNPFFAGCAVGVYYIWPNLALETPAPRTIKRYDNVEEAKAAAQADFEQRILSALEASRVAPVSQKEAAPVVECETCVGTGTIESQNEGAPDFGFTRCPTCSPSPAPAVEPVGIKALEWPDSIRRGQRLQSKGGLLTYTIAHYGGSEPESGVVYRWAPPMGGWSEAFFSYEHAIIAAQADYEARIRSALHTSPTPVSEETCVTCQGNGEIVTDWEVYLHGDDDEHATAECPDCTGEGKVSPTPVSAPVGESER